MVYYKRILQIKDKGMRRDLNRQDHERGLKE